MLEPTSTNIQVEITFRSYGGIKIGNIESYKLPKKWSSHLAYQLTEIKEEKMEEKESSKASISNQCVKLLF